MDVNEFSDRVFQGAPPPIQVGSLRAAIAEFEQRSEHQQKDVAACVLRAAELDRAARDAVKTITSLPSSTTFGSHSAMPSARRWLREWAQPHRRALFGTNEAPFPTVSAAVRWSKTKMRSGHEPRGHECEKAAVFWRRVFETVGQFHSTGRGWCRVEAENRGLRFTTNGREILIPVLPNGHASVIALERSIAQIHERTGISPASLAEFVLTDRLRDSDFRPVEWRLSAHPAIAGHNEVAYRGLITIYAQDLQWSELRTVYTELRRVWTEVAGAVGAAPRSRILTKRLAKLMTSVAEAGGCPTTNQEAFWRRHAAKAGYRTWTAAKQAYWREMRRPRRIRAQRRTN